MATYWTTFRIDERTVGGRSDHTRREALYETIRQLATDKWWRDPTSFVLYNSEYAIDEIAVSIKGEVAPGYDVVLIREADAKNARVIGPVDPDVFVLMPYLKQI